MHMQSIRKLIRIDASLELKQNAICTIIKCQTQIRGQILLNTMYPEQLVPPKSSCFISPFPTLFYFLAPFFLHPS